MLRNTLMMHTKRVNRTIYALHPHADTRNSPLDIGKCRSNMINMILHKDSLFSLNLLSFLITEGI